MPHLTRSGREANCLATSTRKEVVDSIGTENQSLPVLLLADDAPVGLETGQFGERRFVEGKEAILHALSVRYGIPAPHP
jgi:Protein of unknown function (DUF3088)